jgi:CRP-like cAMP-binding protein
MDTFVSSSEAAIEEEVTHPIGQDRAKTAARKGKEKEGSSTQRGSSSSMGDIMSTLKKLDTSFTRA